MGDRRITERIMYYAGFTALKKGRKDARVFSGDYRKTVCTILNCAKGTNKF